MSIKHGIGGTVGCVAYIGYLCLGLLQIAAVESAFMHWMDTDSHILGIILFFPSVFIGMIPVIGAIVGIVGAVQAWEWSVPAAIGLFFAPYIIGMVGYAIMRVCGMDV